MSRSKNGLTCWRELQQTAFDEEKLAASQALRKLQEEQERLEKLDSFQQAIHHREGSSVTTLELNGSWHFQRQLDQAIRHQRQQLAMEQARYRRQEELLKEQQKKLKTADKLIQKREAALMMLRHRQEQKVLDELSAGFVRRLDEYT